MKKFTKIVNNFFKKKISNEHLQELLGRFQKDERNNRLFLVYLSGYLMFIVIYLLITHEIILFIVGASSITGIYLLVYFITRMYSLRVRGKQGKELRSKLESYLISGEKASDEDLESALKKLTLKEFQYRINGIYYLFIALIELSLLLLVIGLISKGLLILEAFSIITITPGLEDHLVIAELELLLILLFYFLLRYMNFKNIRRIRRFLNEIINKKLEKVEKSIETILNSKIADLDIQVDEISSTLQSWSDLYLGSHFVGLRTLMLISDYRAMIYSFDNEMFYMNLLNDLKFKMKEKEKLSSSVELESVIGLVDINIERINASIKNKTYYKEERRAKARAIQTWVTIFGIILSVIFSSLAFLKPS